MEQLQSEESAGGLAGGGGSNGGGGDAVAPTQTSGDGTTMIGTDSFGPGNPSYMSGNVGSPVVQ